jgi:hypothetical protein
MKPFRYVFLILLLMPLWIMGQRQKPEEHQRKNLLEMAQTFEQNFNREHQKALAEAQRRGWPIRREFPDGTLLELQYLLPNGMPVYYQTTNLNAARTVSTDNVWPGGSGGLNLSGNGMTVGEWDGGAVRGTHQELTGRVNQVDGVLTISNHSTHVAGTLIASGVVSNARGMAYQANLDAYDWNNDGAEMATAAAGGLLLSNHSYGFTRGWDFNSFGDGRWVWWGDPSVNLTEDYLFGFYDQSSQNWDDIAYNAPDYLIVKSAGNDRNDFGPAAGTQYWVWNGSTWVLSTTTRNPDGNYDCISHYGVAKNVLTVGAVDDIPGGYTSPSDVIMSTFSSWGPTDDGRIKPDIVANGVSLFSCVGSSNNAYSGTYSGTSMASPNATGSLLLLQQHYQNTHGGDSLRASTLKGLVIHTADEAGPALGPDYMFGWGLLNTETAAEVISNNGTDDHIIEENLYGYTNFEVQVNALGTEPLIVTICWTDPPGTPPAPALDPTTPMLRNDLDLRVMNGITYYPWVLNPANPAAAATTGDNNVDNVEKVYIASPSPGVYTVRVSHKSYISGDPQDFALIISGATLAPPNGILVWDGRLNHQDYSGAYISAKLTNMGFLVRYTDAFPLSLIGYDAVFLSFGNEGGSRTDFNDDMASKVQAYLQSGGSVYLEGGDALGFDQDDNPALLSLFGLDAVADGGDHSIQLLTGQTGALTEGMLFTSSSQVSPEWVDIYTPGASAQLAFEEVGYGTVAVQYRGTHGQKTFCFSYALAPLNDVAYPSTKENLVTRISNFLIGAPQFTKVTTGDIITDGGTSCSWGNYDNDNYIDLYVSGGKLYHNNGDVTFSKVTSGPIFADAGGAGTWGDYDNDGNLDLFVVKPGGQNNLLYKGHGSDGTFTKITSGVVVNDGGNSRAASWGDYNNDGYLDLFVAEYLGNNFLYMNNAGSSFTKITAGEIVNDGGTSVACSWGDFDNDNDIELFVANDLNTNELNFLYVNNGNGTFSRISGGPLATDSRESQGGSWGDYNLFVANWNFNRNNLYENDTNGNFNSILSGPVVSEYGEWKGSGWGDYDNDGDLDLFVAEWEFNNALYSNNGDGTFSKVALGTVVSESRSSYSSSWVDVDNDGDLDLFVANPDSNSLFINLGNNNHWISIKCVGTLSNTAAIGAKVRIKSNISGNAIWQLNEISGQTGAKSQNSLVAEFGLGDATTIDSLMVEWPSGIVQILTGVAVDQFLTIIEESAQTTDFACSLDVSDNNGISLANPLVFGTAADATNGFDPNYDQYAPPTPPSGVLDGRFRIDNEDFLKDFRATNTGTVEWHLIYQPSTNGDPVTLSWDPAELAPEGSFRLVDYFTGGSLVDINMRSQNSFTDNLSLLQMKIVYSLTTTFDMAINSSWNILGLPLEVDDGYYLTLFPNAIPGTLFKFDETYQQTDTLKPGEGYWLRFPAAEVVPLEGYPFMSYSLALKEGWNMIAGVSCNVPLSNVIDPGGIIIPGTLYGFYQTYVLADTIKQGQGYWIRTNATGTISLTCGTAFAKSSVNTFVQDLDPARISTVEISDAAGASQTLYLDVHLDDPSHKLSYSLPPVPPSGSFDARFEGGYRLSETGEAIIQIQSSNYPVTLKFSLASPSRYIIKEIVNGRETVEHMVETGGSIQITNPLVKSLVLSKLDEEIPSTFVVEQNYPNPFNPATVIRYAIPQPEKVEIVIYNALGQRVKTLVSKRQDAGYYDVTWDANNDGGQKISSGIYFYRVQAGNYSAIKKMLLVK